MKRIPGFVLSLVLVVPAFSAELEGYLMDKACSARAVKNGYKAAGSHNKDCALMDGCHNTGFGVLTADNKYILFDKAGSAKAKAALEKSSKADNLKVKVTGDVTGNTMKVTAVQIL